MASGFDSVWAIDLGNSYLKALRLSRTADGAEVIGFDNIQHSKILTGGDVKPDERDELIALSLRQFIRQNDMGKDAVMVSVPSQNGFARFVNLPPVAQKRIPEIVRFEAAQQIPFDINDVQWDWQIFEGDKDTESKVGIFAIKNEIVGAVLEHFGRENINVSHVQMASMALYNYALYDRSDLLNSDREGIIILDIGAENSDLVVCTKSTVWQRSIPMGGNAFTKAIAEAFKLNFEKAEKLKRTATMSKYARQIFQAMRPVFTELVGEIQRSLGFYGNSNPDVKLSKIIAVGGGTKMRGLLKYLQQSLQIPVEKPDSFKRLTMGTSVSAAKFHENVSDFGVVYGLALQGLGLGRIVSNLLPRRISRSMEWSKKSKYFTAAACLLLVVSILGLARTNLDKVSYNSSENVRLRSEVQNVIDRADEAERKLQTQKNRSSASAAIIEKELAPFKYRDVIPLLHQMIISVLPNERNNPEQKELYRAFADGDVKKIREIWPERKERKQIFLANISVYFTQDLESAQFRATEVMARGGRRMSRGSAGGGMTSEDLEIEARESGLTGAARSKFAQTYARQRTEGTTAGTAEENAGFVVTIMGYCPYGDIRELMEPLGADEDKNKWGVITRLMHLDDLKEVFDGNSPFKLYKKLDVNHFKLEIGEVDLNAETPPGIGFVDAGPGKVKGGRDGSTEQVLIDPMTKEVISKVVELDENGKEKRDRYGNTVYKTNDYWFKLDVKFVWREAPKEAKSSG
ncbi:MAG: type IV pilus assembly protein PilM [Sedimentisphaerales bacterium]|nr:type IV pilus assembly protein PilM [Sedimentisphaerales bacterium]